MLKTFIFISYKVRGEAIPAEDYPTYNAGYHYQHYTEVIEKTEGWEHAYDSELIEDLRELGAVPPRIAAMLQIHSTLFDSLAKIELCFVGIDDQDLTTPERRAKTNVLQAKTEYNKLFDSIN